MSFFEASAGGHSSLPSPSPRTAAATKARQRPHICFVAPHFWPVFTADPRIQVAGGAEVQQSRLARLLARNGHEVSVVCEDYGQPAEVQQDGIRMISTFRAQDGLPILRFFHPRLSSVWRALGRANADIYYVRAAGMILSIVTAYCRLHGRKSLYAGASDGDFDPGRQLIQYRRDRWLYEQGLAKADAIVVQNEIQQRLCRENYGRDSTLIPSLYELPAQASANGGDCVLWVAALRRTKRPELFLEMAHHLPHRRFVMIGGPAGSSAADHDFFESMRHRAAALSNVEFLGFLPLPKVEPHFDRARVLVNTSTVEGLPNTFLQAWARGVPTIALQDAGAGLAEIPAHMAVADIPAGVAAIERMFTDAPHHSQAATRCRDYFHARHGSSGILAQYQYLLETLAMNGTG